MSRSPRGQSSLNAISHVGGVPQDVGFPETQHLPTGGIEGRGGLTVALEISLDLGRPVGRVVTAPEPFEASVQVAPVPKVTIAKDCDTFAREDDVRAADQLADVETITKSATP